MTGYMVKCPYNSKNRIHLKWCQNTYQPIPINRKITTFNFKFNFDWILSNLFSNLSEF